jgi:hypothetical protein
MSTFVHMSALCEKQSNTVELFSPRGVSITNFWRLHSMHCGLLFQMRLIPSECNSLIRPSPCAHWLDVCWCWYVVSHNQISTKKYFQSGLKIARDRWYLYLWSKNLSKTSFSWLEHPTLLRRTLVHSVQNMTEFPWFVIPISRKWTVCLSWNSRTLPTYVESTYCENISQIGFTH